jgi:hypothetical protein
MLQDLTTIFDIELITAFQSTFALFVNLKAHLCCPEVIEAHTRGLLFESEKE